MKTEKPAAPEGCVYGPWWAELESAWFCSANNYRGVPYLHKFDEESSAWRLAEDDPDDVFTRELLRLAALNARLVERLTADNKQKELSLRNCLHLAAKADHYTPETIKDALIRFCGDAGVKFCPLRGNTEEETKE